MEHSGQLSSNNGLMKFRCDKNHKTSTKLIVFCARFEASVKSKELVENRPQGELLRRSLHYYLISREQFISLLDKVKSKILECVDIPVMVYDGSK